MPALAMALLLTGASGFVQPDARPGPPVAVPGPPLPPPPHPPVREWPDLNAYISPMAHLTVVPRERGEWNVGVRLDIGADGRVADCTITGASGVAALDQATCRILRALARYRPARDRAGNPVPGTDNGRLHWRWPPPEPPPPGTPGVYPHPVPMVSPPAPPPPRTGPAPAERQRALQYLFEMDDFPAAAFRLNEQGATAVRLAIGPDGRVSDCIVTASSGSAALDTATCRILRSRARYRPALDAASVPVSGSDEGRIVWTLPPG